MKKSPLLFLIIAGILLSACFKTEAPPPLKFNGEANMTIAQFQQLHELKASYPPTYIDSAIIITGIVTSTDQYGSCYKEIFLQDSTGGISIRTANTAYAKKFSIGQKIFIKTQGLYLGNYISGTRYGFYQLGLYGNANGGTEYISTKMENKHIFRSGYPVAEPEPKIIIKDGDIIKGIGGDYHTLVKLVNCEFTEANGATKYFEPSGTLTTISRPIKLSGGGTVEARISKQCDFAKDTLPSGPLDIVGLLTMYGTTAQSTHQLIIRNIKDVHLPPPVQVLLSYDMTTDPFSDGWTNKQIKGDNVFTYFPAEKYVKIQPPSGNETECWLVSPKIPLFPMLSKGERNVSLTFKYRVLSGGTNENIQVAYTVDGTNWKPLAFTLQSGVAEAVIKLEDDIATNPNLQIAFQYKTTEKYPAWYIMNVAFKTNVN
jgi:hypothetical protein